MIKKFISTLCLLLSLSFSLISCNNKDNFNQKLLDNYIIEKGEKLTDAKVTRISEVFKKIGISGVSLEINWNYDKSTLFFEEDCQMNRNELGALYEYLNNEECKFEKEKYTCLGTPYYAYNTKKNKESLKYSFETNGLEEHKCYAVYFICDLQEYKITSKENNKTFNVYNSIGNFFVSLECVE